MPSRELTDEQRADPRFAFRVFMVHRTANRSPGADLAVELVTPGSTEASEINRIMLKEVEKKKYLPSDVVKILNSEGFKKFTITSHTGLWQKLKAKDPAKVFGVTIGKQWYWYETWLNRVREECQKQSALSIGWHLPFRFTQTGDARALYGKRRADYPGFSSWQLSLLSSPVGAQTS
jgi:hypothetical protein